MLGLSSVHRPTAFDPVLGALLRCWINVSVYEVNIGTIMQNRTSYSRGVNSLKTECVLKSLKSSIASITMKCQILHLNGLILMNTMCCAASKISFALTVCDIQFVFVPYNFRMSMVEYMYKLLYGRRTTSLHDQAAHQV